MHQSFLGTETEKQGSTLCVCCTSRRLKWSGALIALFGVGVLLVALLLPGVIESKLNAGIDDYVSLAPKAHDSNSVGFRTWANTADPDAATIYESVYIFNVTNPAEVLADNTTKPIVTQHGPYVYRNVKVKFDFTYGQDYDNHETLEYKQWTYYEFQRDQTPADLDPEVDRYTTVNMPFQAISNVINTKNNWAYYVAWGQYMDAGMCGQTLYGTDQTRLFTNQLTVTQLLFGGSDGCLTKLVPPAGLTPDGQFSGILGTNLPPSAVNNQSTVGPLIAPDTVYTGENEPALMRQYAKVGGDSYLSVWGSPNANRVSGTDGAQFSRDVKEGSTVNTWVDELSRYTALINRDWEHVSIHGIDLLRFTLDQKIMYNETLERENAAFNMYVHNGILNMTSSKEGFPLFMSKPHFLDADDSLVKDIIGLAPERDLHDTRIDVEPITGATMRAHKRLQVNVRASPLVNGWMKADYYKTMGEHYMPVVWVDQHAELSSSKASSFKKSVYGAQDGIKYVKLVGAIVGATLVGLALIMLIAAITRSAKEQAKATNVNEY